jgi:hypothetical protein
VWIEIVDTRGRPRLLNTDYVVNIEADSGVVELLMESGAVIQSDSSYAEIKAKLLGAAPAAPVFGHV